MSASPCASNSTSSGRRSTPLSGPARSHSQVVEADGALVARRPADTSNFAAKRMLEAHGHVAQSDGAMSLIEQRTGRNSHRVSEIDYPCTLGRTLCHLFGDFQQHGHRPQGLGKAARARSFPVLSCRTRWAASRQRVAPVDRPLVHWMSTKSAPSRASSRLVVAVYSPDVPPRRRMRFGQTADHLEPLTIDVEQRDLVRRQPGRAARDAIDQVRGIRAAPADHRYIRFRSRHRHQPASTTLCCVAYKHMINRGQVL